MNKRQKVYIFSAVALFIVQMLLVFSICGRSVRKPFQGIPEFYGEMQSVPVDLELREEWKRIGARSYFNWRAAESLLYAHVLFGAVGLVLFVKGMRGQDLNPTDKQ